MNTNPFDDAPQRYRRADDEHVADEHAWTIWLNTGPISSFFPVTFPTGVTVDPPRLRCVLCGAGLMDVRGRVRKTAAAAVIEAAAMCPDCNDVTACDVRIRPDGTLQSLHGLGLETYALSLHVPAVVRDPATNAVVLVEPYRQAAPQEMPDVKQSMIERLAQWAKSRFWDWA